jgi:hypothetical protein
MENDAELAHPTSTAITRNHEDTHQFSEADLRQIDVCPSRARASVPGRESGITLHKPSVALKIFPLSPPGTGERSSRSLTLGVSLPGVLDDQAEQRQSLLLLVDNFPRQDVELGLQASRTAINVQHVREQHKIHRADPTTVIDAHIE